MRKIYDLIPSNMENKKKRVVAVFLTLLVLLQFPADFGSVAYAAQKNEIRGTISVASNISQQDM